MALEDPLHDERRQEHLLLHRVDAGVLLEPRAVSEAIGPDVVHQRTGALMEAKRGVQPFDGIEDRIEDLLPQHPPAYGVRSGPKGTQAQLVNGVVDRSERKLDVEERDRCSTEKPPASVRYVFDQPSAVGAGDGVGKFGIHPLDPTLIQRAVEDGDVDAFDVERSSHGLRAEVVGGDVTEALPDGLGIEAERLEGTWGVLHRRPTVDQGSGRVLPDAAPILLVEVALQQVTRLEGVAVGIDDQEVWGI